MTAQNFQPEGLHLAIGTWHFAGHLRETLIATRMCADFGPRSGWGAPDGASSKRPSGDCRVLKAKPYVTCTAEINISNSSLPKELHAEE
jgi:hypothetical protein